MMSCARLSSVLSLGLAWGCSSSPPTDTPPALDGAAGGKIIMRNIGASADTARAVAIQADGKILVGGEANTPEWHPALARYLPTGALDPAFGTGGRSSCRSAPASPESRCSRTAGFAGYSLAPMGEADFALARFLPNGALDPSFGGGGFVTTNFGGVDEANAILLQPDGKIVLAGTTSNGGDFALVRYASDGSPDPGFGSSSLVTTSFGFGVDRANAIVRRPDGRLLVAGSTT